MITFIKFIVASFLLFGFVVVTANFLGVVNKPKPGCAECVQLQKQIDDLVRQVHYLDGVANDTGEYDGSPCYGIYDDRAHSECLDYYNNY